MFDVDDLQVVAAEQSVERREAEVAEMLVVDRVEFDVVNQILEVWALDNGNAARLEHLAEAGNDSVQIGHMGQDIVGVDDVRSTAF